MNAPDKIYLQVCGECNLKGSDCKKCKFDSEVTTWCEDKIFDRDVEYIRKDVFIGKACVAYCKVCDTQECFDNECDWVTKFRRRLKKELK